jgi:ammonium transporter
MGFRKLRLTFGVCFLLSLWMANLCAAQDVPAADNGGAAASVPPADPWTMAVTVDTIWVLVTAFLVFFMNTGFGCVEAGFCRSKNAVNILAKNFVVFAISSLAYWLLGFAIMFGTGNDFLGTTGWLVQGADNSPVTASLATLVKADINTEYGIDLDDAATAERYQGLIESIDEQSGKAGAETTSTDQTVAVSLDIPDRDRFEKDYSAAEFYWGVYGAISWTGVPLFAKFFFQLVFAGTAATIVSGCVAERIHYRAFMFFTIFVVAISYPITGHWIWGGGWLASLGFWDFAGSTVVHSVGGWAGLAGILLLGPRIGKYRDGKLQAIPGHSMALAFLGGMILWLGWFGFNPGSTMAISGAVAKDAAHIVVTTNLACSAGMLSATVLAWTMLGKPDFSMTVNGALAGLVAVTAPCAWITPIGSVIIGLIGGILVVVGVLAFDRLKIDDPVGALSVHLVNGIWGTLSIGLFANPEAVGYSAGPEAGLFCGGGITQLLNQAIGVAAVGALTFGGSLIVWAIIKSTLGLRVEPQEEMRGLDLSEMGMEAYAPDSVA